MTTFELLEALDEFERILGNNHQLRTTISALATYDVELDNAVAIIISSDPADEHQRDAAINNMHEKLFQVTNQIRGFPLASLFVQLRDFTAALKERVGPVIGPNELLPSLYPLLEKFTQRYETVLRTSASTAVLELVRLASELDSTFMFANRETQLLRLRLGSGPVPNWTRLSGAFR